MHGLRGPVIHIVGDQGRFDAPDGGGHGRGELPARSCHPVHRLRQPCRPSSVGQDLAGVPLDRAARCLRGPGRAVQQLPDACRVRGEAGRGAEASSASARTGRCARGRSWAAAASGGRGGRRGRRPGAIASRSAARPVPPPAAGPRTPATPRRWADRRARRREAGDDRTAGRSSHAIGPVAARRIRSGRVRHGRAGPRRRPGTGARSRRRDGGGCSRSRRWPGPGVDRAAVREGTPRWPGSSVRRRRGRRLGSAPCSRSARTASVCPQQAAPHRGVPSEPIPLSVSGEAPAASSTRTMSAAPFTAARYSGVVPAVSVVSAGAPARSAALTPARSPTSAASTRRRDSFLWRRLFTGPPRPAAHRAAGSGRHAARRPPRRRCGRTGPPRRRRGSPGRVGGRGHPPR